MKRLLFSLLISAAAALAPALAVEPDEMLDDPALEARAREIDGELRCVVCQSQSIAESDAPLARDMRVVVRERLAAGDSDGEVRDYLVERYGNYVLLRPPVQGNTLALWLFPAAILLVGAGLGFIYIRNLRREPPAALDEEEEKIIRAMIDEEKFGR